MPVYEPAEQEQTAPQRKPSLNLTLTALLGPARRYTEIEPELRAQDVHHLAYVLAEMGCWVGGSVTRVSPLVEQFLQVRSLLCR